MDRFSALSKGKKIAIAVGIPLVIVGIIVLIYFISMPSGPKYAGCYNDKEARAIPGNFENLSFAACKDKAMKMGAHVFGIQYGDPNTSVGQCFVDPNTTLESAQRYGPASNCTAMPGQNNIIPNAHMGMTWSNALYTI